METVVLSLGFGGLTSWLWEFFPGLKDWFNGLSRGQKKAITALGGMIGALAAALVSGFMQGPEGFDAWEIIGAVLLGYVGKESAYRGLVR